MTTRIHYNKFIKEIRVIIEFINFNKCLDRSFNEYLLYINENELKLKRKDKNKLGIHFIIKELVRVCRESDNKKWF